MVTSFIYLGGVISAVDDNWAEVVRNMTKTLAVWRRMTSILRREEVRPRLSGFFFKSVIHSVLLFGVETCVFTPCMGRILGGFQDQVSRRLMGRLLRRREYWNGEYTSVEAARARAEAGFETMETYIS